MGGVGPACLWVRPVFWAVVKMAQDGSRKRTLSELGKMSIEELKAEFKRVKNYEATFKAGEAPPKPVPSPDIWSPEVSIPQRLRAVQDFIEALKYNFVGKEYYSPEKKFPLSRVMKLAMRMVQDSLPIKCLEAAILAIYLTKDMENITRVPLRFATVVGQDAHVYWHIVLAIRHDGKWGSLGLSRRQELMYKPLVYDSLFALASEFKASYKRIGHRVVKATVGLPIVTEEKKNAKRNSNDKLYYHFLVIPVSKIRYPWEGVESLLAKFTKQMYRIRANLQLNGSYKVLENSEVIRADGSWVGLVYKPPEAQKERVATPVKKKSTAQDAPEGRKEHLAV